MKGVLRRIIDKYGTYGVDWMGFVLSRKNKLTYHHIDKKCEKGKKTIDNGAPLTKRGHNLLNYIELEDYELYEDWNNLFRQINDSEQPPTEEHYEKMKMLRLRGRSLENYLKDKK